MCRLISHLRGGLQRFVCLLGCSDGEGLFGLAWQSERQPARRPPVLTAPPLTQSRAPSPRVVPGQDGHPGTARRDSRREESGADAHRRKA
jgi:hypothetical protein